MFPQVVSRYVGDHVVMNIGCYGGGIDATVVSETVGASCNIMDAVVPFTLSFVLFFFVLRHTPITKCAQVNIYTIPYGWMDAHNSRTHCINERKDADWRALLTVAALLDHQTS